jgi:hypothetical protein
MNQDMPWYEKVILAIVAIVGVSFVMAVIEEMW